ncbi:CHAT domain-containing protein [Phyllosticta capitalensis]
MDLGSLQRLVVTTWVTDQGWRHDNVESNNSHTGLDISFRFYLQAGAIDIPPDSPPVFIASLMSSAGIQCGPPPHMSLLPSARIRCHTQEWSFGEPNEDDKQNGMQRTFLQNFPTDKTLEFGVIPSVRSKGSVWKMEVEVHSESPLPSGQTGNEQGHIRPIPMNRQAKSWRFLESSETAHLRRQTLDAAIQNHPDTENFYDRVETALTRLFNIAKSQGSLNEAIEIANVALDIVPQDSHNYGWWINSLGIELNSRARCSGSIDDLKKVIALTEMILPTIPEDDNRRAILLNNLGGYLCTRFSLTGATEDLTTGVNKTLETVKMFQLDDPNYEKLLGNFSGRICPLYCRTGSLECLSTGVKVAEFAIRRLPVDHPTAPQISSNLGTLLLCRFEQTGSTRDIDSAVCFASVAVLGAVQTHPQYVEMLGNLGMCLARRFEWKDSLEKSTMGDLDPKLKSSLAKKFKCKDFVDDLDWAVKVSGDAVDLTPQESPLRAMLLLNLANMLGVQFKRTGLQEDLNRRLECCKTGWNCRNAPPSVRIRLAHEAAKVLTSESRWAEASMFLDGAVSLLPAVSPHFLKHTDKQQMLLDWAGLASFSAAAALNAGKSAEHALELLELGRGVIASLLLETRSDFTDLRRDHPELASEFEALRDELDSGMQEITRRYELESRLKLAKNKIRSCRGFEDFFLPLDAARMRNAASSGPIVVVNTNQYRCDAFLLSTDAIRSVALPNLCHDDFDGKLRVSPSVLERLWENVACPILNELGFLQPISQEKLPRLWWILTGSLSRFPLHAAGRRGANSSENVLDQVVSSYSTSIKTLLYARQNSAKKVSKSALLVSMPETPSSGYRNPGDLKSVEKETQLVDDLLRPSMSTTRLKKPQKADVLRSIESSAVFHFAGHGISHFENPARSCLLLDDWVENALTVEDLTSLKLSEKSPWLAYLSACSTGESKIEDLQDEAIHLVSACQLAGFPHVVGSLWPIDDEYSAEAAREVYTTIIQKGWTDEAVALGVHNAAKLLRRMSYEEDWIGRGETGDGTDKRGKQANPVDEKLEGSQRNRDIGGEPIYQSDPYRWAAYVHLGP